MPFKNLSKRIDGRVTITRNAPGDGEPTIRLEIWESVPSSRLVIAEIELAEFAMCVTGLAAVPARLRVFPRDV